MQAKLDMEGSATPSLQLLAEAPDFIVERGWKKGYPTIPTIWAPRETIYVYLQVIQIVLSIPPSYFILFLSIPHP